jgi:hypothetical protein
VQPVGAHYAKLSLLGLSTDTRLDGAGEELPADPEGRYRERQIYAYLEYGLHPRWTLVTSWALKEMEIEAEPAWGTRSTGDLRVGLRRALVQGPRALALEALFSLPTYPASDLSSPAGLRAQNLPAGTGRVEGEVRFLAGLSLHPLPLYGNLDLGYRGRGGPFADLWSGALELGGGGSRVFAKGEVRWIAATGNGAGDMVAGRLSEDESATQVGAQTALRLAGPLWVELGWSHVLAGRNTLAGSQWSLGLVHSSGGN